MQKRILEWKTEHKGVTILLFCVSIMLFIASGCLYFGSGVNTALVYANKPQPPLIQELNIPVLILFSLCASFMILFYPKFVSSAHGSAHWARPDELKRANLLYRAGQVGDELELGKFRRWVVALPTERQNQHVLIVAPAGQDKTINVIAPALLNARGQRGLLVNDLKGELFNLCAGALTRFMRVQMFSPGNIASIHYNPLAHIKTMKEAQNFAISWVNNTGLSRETFWNDTASLLITTIVLHLRDTEPGAPLYRLADIVSSSFDNINKLIRNSQSQEARTIGASFLANTTTNKELARNLTTDITTRFILLHDPLIREITSRDDIDFEQLAGEQPGALFLSIRPDDAERLKPLLATLTMQLMASVVAQRRRFAFFLDGFCNLGEIPHYAEWISTVRGAGLAFIMVIQDFNQLYRIYKQDAADTIRTNALTHVLWSGAGKVETEYYSERIGYTTVSTTATTRTIGRRGIFVYARPSVTELEHRRELITPDELRTMLTDDIVVISGNIPPIRAKSLPYFKRPDLA